MFIELTLRDGTLIMVNMSLVKVMTPLKLIAPSVVKLTRIEFNLASSVTVTEPIDLILTIMVNNNLVK